MVARCAIRKRPRFVWRAALTGHFVLSTIHTNDSLSAVNRLMDMAIEPFLLASTLRVLEAQRLIRRLCKECKQPFECDTETARAHGLEAGQVLHRPKAEGCEYCRGTGYKGRIGVFEVVRITPRMARANSNPHAVAGTADSRQRRRHEAADRQRHGQGARRTYQPGGSVRLLQRARKGKTGERCDHQKRQKM